jgi:hypothetical protein
VAAPRVATVALLGLPGAGRTTLAARLCEVATAGAPGGGRLASLLDLADELKLRGLRKEEPGALPGARTTRQALDAALRDGQLEPGAPEDEALYVEPVGARGRALALLDTGGRRFENDSLADDPLHPHRSLARESAALVLVLDGAAWAAEKGPRAEERDRAEACLRRLAAARRKGKLPPLPIAVVAARADLVPSRGPDAGRAVPDAVRRFADEMREAHAGALEVAAFAVARDDEASLRALLLWLIPRAAPAAGAARRRRLLLAAEIALALVLAVWFAGLFTMRLVSRTSRRDATALESAAARERAFIDEAEREVAFWSSLPLPPPTGGAEEALRRHAAWLEEDLRRDHPALLEPAEAVALEPAQYRTAAEGLLVASRLLGPGAERDALVARLREKARTAEMPPASRATLAAWEELWRTTGDPAVKEGVIAARLRPIYAAIVAEAEREAEAESAYPDLLLPLVRREAGRAPLARELFRAALERQWERASALLYARLRAPGQDDVETLLRAVETAPAPPSDAALERIGRWLAESVVLTPATASADLAPRVERLLGESGARGVWAAVPSLYRGVVESPAEAGPARLAGLRALLDAYPRARLAPGQGARLAALAAHLEVLSQDGTYGLHVRHVQVSSDFGSFLNPFDMTIAVVSERSAERTIGPIARCLELRPANALFGPGELRWRAWERIEVKVTDAGGPVGLFRRGPGTCFGLHDLAGEWADASGRGRMTIEVTPAPPAPFDLAGW